VNAVSSGATGAGLLFASHVVSDIFGTDRNQPFIEVGLFLIVFAAVVYLISRQDVLNKAAVRAVIVVDTLWVVGSLLIVLVHAFDLSTVGYLLITAVAIWVAAMAFLQFGGLNQMLKSN
jgi:hypothetical protein